MDLRKTAAWLLSRLPRPKPRFLDLPDQDWNRICGAFNCLRYLGPENRAELRNLSEGFLQHKRFTARGEAWETLEGPQGNLLKWTVAALACLPILKLGLDSYRSWRSIIMTSEAGTVRQIHSEGNLVTEYDDEVAGEILPLGPVVISIRDLEDTGRGYNVVIHEMAHKLDLLNGELDACPDLPLALQAPWHEAYTQAWEDFQHQLTHPRLRRKLPLDDYAADSPEEFFAVSVEEFFDRPLHLHRVYPKVFQVLVHYFGFDPSQA